MTNKSHDSDVAFIQALAELLNKNNLAEVSVKREYDENDRLKVRVSKYPPQSGQPAIYAAPPAPAPMMAAQGAPAPASAAADAPSGATAGDPAHHPGVVTSPMVGTCYLAPEPGATAFVAVGDPVSEGQTLLIIEAMKTMNHIPAPHAGTVKRILIDDGSPVEFGAPLMIVE